MRHKVATFKVGRSGAHRRAMLANMANSLFINGQIETTLVKAKELRRFAEKLITTGKKGDIHSRRLAFAKLRSRDAVKNLFDVVAPAYAERNGGYTRIYKLGFRRGLLGVLVWRSTSVLCCLVCRVLRLRVLRPLVCGFGFSSAASRELCRL